MTQNKRTIDTPALMEWLGEDRGDNLAIKHGLRIYTVDKFGTLISQRYKRAQARPLHTQTITSNIEGLSDMQAGNTYTISQSEVVVGKLVESNLFGYRFLCVDPKGQVSFVDMDYVDAVDHFRRGNIKQVQLGR